MLKNSVPEFCRNQGVTRGLNSEFWLEFKQVVKGVRVNKIFIKQRVSSNCL